MPRSRPTRRPRRGIGAAPGTGGWCRGNATSGSRWTGCCVSHGISFDLVVANLVSAPCRFSVGVKAHHSAVFELERIKPTPKRGELRWGVSEPTVCGGEWCAGYAAQWPCSSPRPQRRSGRGIRRSSRRNGQWSSRSPYDYAPTDESTKGGAESSGDPARKGVRQRRVSAAPSVRRIRSGRRRAVWKELVRARWSRVRCRRRPSRPIRAGSSGTTSATRTVAPWEANSQLIYH